MSTPVDCRPDADLITATKAGDTAAFGALVRRHQRDALRIAAVALGSVDGADDVAQDAFVKVYKSIHRFRSGSPFEPWLFRILTNTARNHHRSDRRRRSLHLRASAMVGIDVVPPDEIATQRADRHHLVDAINRLRLDDRLVLTYRWYQQMSEAEIATALDCRPGTVKSKLSRAMSRLREELGES